MCADNKIQQQRELSTESDIRKLLPVMNDIEWGNYKQRNGGIIGILNKLKEFKENQGKSRNIFSSNSSYIGNGFQIGGFCANEIEQAKKRLIDKMIEYIMSKVNAQFGILLVTKKLKKGGSYNRRFTRLRYKQNNNVLSKTKKNNYRRKYKKTKNKTKRTANIGVKIQK